MKDKTVCIIGLGYVGLPLAEAFSKHLRVIGYDIDDCKIRELNNRNTNRNIAKPISDRDISVITKRNVPKNIKEEILSNSSKNIDISIFWDLPPTIRFRVLKEGELLYKRDEIALQRVKVATLKSYLDIQPMIKRHCIRILG